MEPLLRSAFLLLILCQLSTARGPPRRSGQVETQQIVKEGETVKLNCPVVGDPKPTLEWTKDREAINSAWTRFRRLPTGLRIKDVALEDAGDYVCKGINGFGTVDIYYTLYVLENTTSDILGADQLPTFAQNSGTAPQFIPYSDMKQIIQRPVGSSVRLKCKASGKPRPLVRWFKDGSLLADYQNKQVHWTFKLRDLEKQDSGKYMCKVFNTAGAINRTFTLSVIEKIQETPELIPPHPLNSTIYSGGRAAFHCKVRSAVQPHIKWLKRVETEADMRNTNNTIDVNGQKFMVLKTGHVAPSKDGTYLNKLYIDPATEDDSGMYICLGTNIIGYNFRSAYLKVLPDPNRKSRFGVKRSNQEGVMTGSSLPLIIALPALVVIVLVGVAIYMVVRQRKTSGKKPQATPPQRQHHAPPPSANMRCPTAPCMQPMLPPNMDNKDVYSKPMMTSPAPSMQSHIAGLQMNGASRERILKNYGEVHHAPPPGQHPGMYPDMSQYSDMQYPMYADVHSDVSSASAPRQYTHAHTHYGF